MKTEQLIDCEGITLESAKPFAFSCCDCGLTHHMSIVSEDGRPVGFAVKRITESAPPAGEATDMLYCAMVELRYGSGDVTLTREMAAALLNQLEGTATQAQPSPHPAVVGSGGVPVASVAAPVGISRSEWIAQAKAFYVESGDDDATARECARYICNQQDWAGGEIGDPREEAQEDIHGRGRTGLAVLAASRVPVAVVVEPEHWDKLRRLGWRQYDCKVCGESWGAMSEPETPPMAVGAGGSVGATHEKPHYMDITRSQGLPDFAGGPVPVLYSDSINGCMVRRDDVWLAKTSQLATPAPSVPAGGEVPETVHWGDAETVGNFILQLKTLDPALPIHAVVFADIHGKKTPLIRGVTLSNERIEGRRFKTGDASVPYSVVVWASDDQRAGKGVREIITETLLNYRCQHHQQDEDNGGLPLSDVLTAPGAKDIGTGLAEIELLADEIASDLHIPLTSQDAAPAVAVEAPEGFALVPLRLTREMDDVIAEEGWQWEDLLAAAGAITQTQYDEITERPPIEDSLTQEDAIQLLCVRDYLEANNVGDALYAFAHFFDHEGCQINPWARLEERALPWKSEGVATPLQPQDAKDARLEAAFDDGWRLCTHWARRDDLLADTGSKPYREARAVCIAAILATKGTP